MWPENVDAVELFGVVLGQWRVIAGFGQARYLALDYAAVESVMNMRGVKKKHQARLLGEIRVMEAAAAKELNRKRDG